MHIKTEITNREIDMALAGGIPELWSLFSSLDGDAEFDTELNIVKFGVDPNCLFDIRSIIEGEFEKKVAFDKVVIERKLQLNLTDFRDEMDRRERRMRNVIRSLYDDSFDSQVEEKLHGYQQ